jgi:hypothetical protein
LEQELAALTEQLIAASDDTEAQLTLLRDTTYRSVTPSVSRSARCHCHIIYIINYYRLRATALCVQWHRMAPLLSRSLIILVCHSTLSCRQSHGLEPGWQQLQQMQQVQDAPEEDPTSMAGRQQPSEPSTGRGAESTDSTVSSPPAAAVTMTTMAVATRSPTPGSSTWLRQQQLVTGAAPAPAPAPAPAGTQ